MFMYLYPVENFYYVMFIYTFSWSKMKMFFFWTSKNEFLFMMTEIPDQHKVCQPKQQESTKGKTPNTN
jgi:hypothetical protein